MIEIIGICGLMWIPTASADDCNGLDQNQNWISEFNQLNDDYKKESWKSALEHAKILEGICDLSPILNYTIAHIHKNLGNEEKYAFYLQKSTQNTERFSVDKDLLDKIWSEKYIATHPEASPETIDAKNNLIITLQNDLDEANQKIANMQTKLNNNSSELSVHHNETKDLTYRNMWISAGFGIAGLAFASAGIALVTKYESGDVDRHDNEQGELKYTYSYSNQPLNSLGWAFVGAGAAMTVVSTVFTAIYGYQYTHSELQTFSFAVTPTHASLSLSF